MIADVPQPNDWAELFGKVPTLDRPLRVALPCCSIDACGVALDCLGVKWHACNVCDLEDRYAEYLRSHFSPAADGLHIGVGGDVTTYSASDLERNGPVDFLVSGPPCPPWASCGRREGLEWGGQSTNHFGLRRAPARPPA